MARTLPWVEIAVGILLIVGLGLRVSSSAVSLMLVVFMVAMLHAYAKGQEISCGCFGPGEQISKWTLLRDGSMLAGSLFLTWMALRGPRRVS
jgi:uncharacterized membrane protein YphA (DoxX/SURF4 family)